MQTPISHSDPGLSGEAGVSGAAGKLVEAEIRE